MEIKRKVFDCFPFWKELDILEIRLNELNEIVDKFVIVESEWSHSGDKKPLYLRDNLQKFKKFRDKIVLISDYRFKKTESPMQRENYQRNLINKGLKISGARKQDLIILSDCDEIPRASVIRNLYLEPQNCILELDGYISYFNLFLQKWNRGRVLLYKDFKGAQKTHRDYFIQNANEMRRYKFIPFLRINPFFASGWIDRNLGAFVGFSPKPLPLIRNAGWHFTKMFPPETILESVYASSHTEFRSDVKGLEDIIYKRSHNQVYYGSKEKGIIVKLDSSFPEFITKNQDRFKEFIKPVL